ncbi:putative transmembrane protein [Toxoplasma gondii VAND]|uniref:Putative transmembrane protein n=1 Tax=Toxoplasma gondii VAND TaxID=933077 RepID=A0A086Q0I5_TOXGO|nr:putative transmembrane protein [Toxoplasma gondii VAND]
MPVTSLPSRKMSSRRRHGDSDDEDFSTSVQQRRPTPVREEEEETELTSSVEDDDSDDGVNDPASRTDLYPSVSRQFPRDTGSPVMSHHGGSLQLWRLSSGSSGTSQTPESIGQNPRVWSGPHSAATKGVSTRYTTVFAGSRQADGGETPRRGESPTEDALQLRGTKVPLPAPSSDSNGSGEWRSARGAHTLRGFAGEVSPRRMQRARSPDLDAVSARGHLESLASSSRVDDWRQGSAATHQAPLTGFSRQAIRSQWWSRANEGEPQVLRHVFEELCSDEYEKDDSKPLACCGFCPLIVTRKGWKSLFSVFWQDYNFDLLMRDYILEFPQRQNHDSTRAPSYDVGPPSNTMFSAGRAASQHRGQLRHVGTMAEQYAGRVAQFSKDPESGIKHKTAARRLTTGYPFVTFRYRALNHAYDYLLGQVVPVKVIWATALTIVGQVLLSVFQLLVARDRAGLFADVVIRAGVCLGLLTVLFVFPLFARFRCRAEVIVTSLASCFFVFCCIFETWQMIGGRTGLSEPLSQQERNARVGCVDLNYEGNNFFEVLVVVVLTATSVRTSLLFYMHMAAILNVVFPCVIKCAIISGGLARLSTATEGYFNLCTILVAMYMGYYKEVSHRLAFYSWYCAKYRICPAGGTRKLSNMATMSR